jgi:hypothetical protein
LLNLLVPARLLKGRRITPGVVVEGEEIAALLVWPAVHVAGHLESVAVDIGCRVSNGNLAIFAGLDIRSDITRYGLDVRGSKRRRIVIDDLVGRVEEQRIVVLGECINCGKDELKVDFVIRHLNRRHVVSVERVLGTVDIESEIDAGVGQQLHAGVVVGRVVDRVYANGIDAQLLELGHITGAACGVGNWVLLG